MKKIMIFLVIIFLSNILLSSNINAIFIYPQTNIIYVDNDGNAEFTKIQYAINSANSGDIIYVYEGIYNENLIINKSIILIGENRNNTIINGNKIDNVVSIINSNVEISEFTIKNSGKSGRHSGINIFSSNAIIYNNLIFNNTIGIIIEFSNNCDIKSNKIFSNNDSGIHILNSYEINISANQVYSNRWGIFNTLSYNNTIGHNQIYFNKLYGIWLLRGSFGNIIHHNNIYKNNIYGINLLLFSGYNLIHNNSISYSNISGINIGNYWSCDGNFLTNNEFLNNLNTGIYIQESNNNMIIKNNFINNKIDASFKNCNENIWNQNYWNGTRNFPKIIKGKLNLIPWFNIDLNPLNEPYNLNLKKEYLEYNIPINIKKEFTNNIELPIIFSWSDINAVDYVPPIKNQNPAPTCEAYALCASLETLVQYKLGYPSGCDLSEAHLFFNSGGTCDWGVDIQETLEYLINYGVPDEGCFPDPHRPYDSPLDSISGWENRTIKILEWGWVENNIESIKKALIKYGPLVICQMTRRDLDLYTDGVYMPKLNSPIQRGHVVTIVGYNDNEGCWTIRNSGGPNWGEDGYYRISYEAFNPIYSFIYSFYGGTGIIYIDGIYGNLNPTVPKIEIIKPKLFHTYFLENEIKTIFKRVDSIQRAAPRIFGSLTIEVDTINTEKVEFIVDGTIQYTDNSPPYTWNLDAEKGLHNLEVIAYNNNFISKDLIDFHIL